MSVRVTINELIELLDGELLSGKTDLELNGASIDSREITSGGIYFARLGEQADGHDYIDSAIENGAKVCVVEKEIDKEYADCSIIKVDDSTKAYGELAKWWRARLKCPVIAITGSNGKTTSKEILASLLGVVVGRGSWSHKSYNNHIGLPKSILDASEDDEFLVLEAGMNNPGELDYLGGIAKPDVAILLNVGSAHIGHLGSKDNIARAKCELLAHAKKVVIPYNDKLIEKHFSSDCEKRTFGLEKQADFYAEDINQTNKSLSYILNAQHNVKLNLYGTHNVLNSLACIAASSLAFPEIEISNFATALSELEPVNMRFETINVGPYLFINDAYNANPVSMKASIMTAKELTDDSFTAILGDMGELGEDSQKYHSDLGEVAAKNGVNKLIAVGENADTVVSSAKRLGLNEVFACASKEEALKVFLSNKPEPGSLVLFKASRALALETLIDELINVLKD